MRICPACKTRYPEGESLCARDGETLVEDNEAFSMSDTLEGSAAVASGTPIPVRSNTPTPSPRKTPGPAVPDDSIIGSLLAGRYEVTRRIGEGGMGAVYEARHTLIGKRVAIKVLLDKYAQKADVVARLQQEARLASSIGHENIVDITDFGETDDGRTFVVMEFLEGDALAAILQREGPLPPRRAVAIARQIASALEAAHGKGVVHRDVKPENVFITRRNDKDFVKVVDFGISKLMKAEAEEGADAAGSPRLTQTGMVLGTPLYMSPEQARGEEDLDHRIDVYALGVILYECLTGEVPFHGTNYLSIISQVLGQDPKPPSQARPDLEISAALEGVVVKAMAKDRAVRYQTMGALDADLARIERGDVVDTSIASPPPRRAGTQVLVWIGAVGLVAAAVAIAVPRLVGTPEARSAVVPAAVAPEPVAPPVVAPPKGIEKVKVVIRSEPAGAEVWWGSVKQGTTPATIDFPKGDERIEFTVMLAGYQEARAPFFPTEDKTVEVTLRPVAVEKPSGRTPKPPKPPKAPGDKQDPTGGEIPPSPFKPK
jgi:eukaryotic-like serine/threonine-protein kinase